jgi:hypothetical protein
MVNPNSPVGRPGTARAGLPYALAAVLAVCTLHASAAWAEPVYAPPTMPIAPPAAAQPPPGKPNTRLNQTRINAGHGMAQFTFAGVGAVSGFECVLVKQVKHRRKRPHFKLCGSPRAYRGLKSGHYLFKARAYGSGGLDRSPARLKFTITRGARRR